MQELQVRSLGWEDPLEEGMATHSSILAWDTPWTEEPDGLQSMESQRVRHDCATNTFQGYFYRDLSSSKIQYVDVRMNSGVNLRQNYLGQLSGKLYKMLE